MRIIAVGDIHGRDSWREILLREEYDRFLFIGDYFDAKDDISPYFQEENFKEIISIKCSSPERIVLLFGNHDYHYLKGVTECYSGYQESQRSVIEKMLEEARSQHLLQMCFQYNDFLFSHAGVTKTWLSSSGFNPELSSVENYINDLFKFKPQKFGFKSGENNCYYGDDVTQSPIWVRPASLCKDLISTYKQVVGHTQQEQITILDNRVILIDALKVGQYLSITNGIIKTEQL